MEFSQKGIDLLKKLEGFKAKPYLDVAGNWTIGYGTLIGHSLGQFTKASITEDEAERLLLERAKPVADEINHLVAVPLTQNQFDALVCFAYNVGIHAFASSTLLVLLNKKLYDQAAFQFERWCKADGVKIQGLLNRRLQEKQLFLEN